MDKEQGSCPLLYNSRILLVTDPAHCPPAFSIVPTDQQPGIGYDSTKISISGNGSIQLFRFEGKKKFVPDECLRKHSSSASQVHFAKFRPNDMLVSGGDDSRLVLWNLNSGKCNGTSAADNNVKEATSVCVAQEVQHGSKINWISSTSLTQNIFVADLTNDISVYCLT